MLLYLIFDDNLEFYVDEMKQPAHSRSSLTINAFYKLIAFRLENTLLPNGFAIISSDTVCLTDLPKWKCTTEYLRGTAWTKFNYDDSSWSPATVSLRNYELNELSLPSISPSCSGISACGNNRCISYCRLSLLQ